ncbi:MAG: hypothetical protein KAS66_09375, partial [Candidatus Omnitrophica bacterium]|nr:hypothetical protein [Candidatus Omnitrophota bacterium]
PYFLKYMNNALDIYEEYDEVMHIAGYMFPVKGQLPSTFFYRVTSSWGWGTWKRAWDKFESNEYALLKRLKSREKRHEFDIQGTIKYYRMLVLQAIGVNDSWAIRWYASVFLNNGLCLHPGKSLVNNIGHDDSGVHSISTNVYDVKISKEKDFSFTTDISESKKAVTLMANFYYSIKKPIYISVYNKIKQVIKRAFE